jgi:hypothetical protein
VAVSEAVAAPVEAAAAEDAGTMVTIDREDVITVKKLGVNPLFTCTF